jgi:hypothetical protein
MLEQCSAESTRIWIRDRESNRELKRLYNEELRSLYCSFIIIIIIVNTHGDEIYMQDIGLKTSRENTTEEI